MHDGSIATLEEVVHHYNTGGKAHPIATRLYGPLHLSSEEEQAIVAF